MLRRSYINKEDPHLPPSTFFPYFSFQLLTSFSVFLKIQSTGTNKKIINLMYAAVKLKLSAVT